VMISSASIVSPVSRVYLLRGGSIGQTTAEVKQSLQSLEV
jgi:hypothetical protein